MNTPTPTPHKQRGLIGRIFAILLLLLFLAVSVIVLVAWRTLSQVDASVQDGAQSASQPQTVEMWTPNGGTASGTVYLPNTPPPTAASAPAAASDLAEAVPLEAPKKPKPAPAATTPPPANSNAAPAGEVPLKPINVPTEVKPKKPAAPPSGGGGGSGNLDNLF